MADENKKAHWIDVTSELWSGLCFKHYQCSACGFETGIKTDKYFICGAEMSTEE